MYQNLLKLKLVMIKNYNNHNLNLYNQQSKKTVLCKLKSAVSNNEYHTVTYA